jgi:Domain of unknown function (DUF6046)
MAVIIRSISDSTNTTVQYQGKSLPADKKVFTPIPTDLTNNPSRLRLYSADFGLVLPQDSIIYLSGEKKLAMTEILDGVVVYERILRKPYSLEFEFTLRTMDPNNNGQYIFPQEDLLNLWTNVWLPDSVVNIDNTYLNKLGIQEMIIEEITPVTVRGSKNLPVRIRGYENVPGLSLIING